MNYNHDESLNYIFVQLTHLYFLRTHSLLDKIGLYPGQPPLLFKLEKNNGLSQKELADALSVKPSTITMMIKRMEKNELIRREQDEKDQRVSRIFITNLGLEKTKQLRELNEELEKEYTADFTQEEKILLRRFFIQMRDNLKVGYNMNKKGRCDLDEKG